MPVGAAKAAGASTATHMHMPTAEKDARQSAAADVRTPAQPEAQRQGGDASPVQAESHRDSSQTAPGRGPVAADGRTPHSTTGSGTSSTPKDEAVAVAGAAAVRMRRRVVVLACRFALGSGKQGVCGYSRP